MSKIDEVVHILQDRITKGIYFAGQRLPSERDLAEEFHISRSTVRAALLKLQAEGLIDIVPRGGIFVRSSNAKDVLGSDLQKIEGQELHTTNSYMEVMQKNGREVIVRFLERSTIVPASTDIAKQMNIPPDTELFRRYRVQIVDRVPYRIMEGYYLASLLGELCERDQKAFPILKWDETYVPFFKWLREMKAFDPTKVKERIYCRMPNEDEAEILHIARNQPVIELHRWVWGKFRNQSEEILYEFSRFVCNASLHEFEYTYPISHQNDT